MFLPYLSGERTPHNNLDARACFVDLHAGHEAVDLAYAVMQGVALGLRDGCHAMGRHGSPSMPLTLVGGGAHSDVCAQLMANAVQCPLQRPPAAHAAAALGAARLAWLAAGGARE
jgi:xylulokinase